MIFKTVELPCVLYMTFDDDNELYEGELVSIVDIDDANDRCVLVVDGIMPQSLRLKVPYSALDGDIIDFGAGVKLGLVPDIR